MTDKIRIMESDQAFDRIRNSEMAAVLYHAPSGLLEVRAGWAIKLHVL